MGNTARIITVFGGSGFVGQYVVRELARAGYRLRLVERDIHNAAALKTQGEVGQIAVLHADITKPDTYVHALQGSYGVVNLVGLLFEKGRQTFESLHHQAAKTLAEHAVHAGVTRLLHMSALGVDKASTSAYASTKLAGEQAVQAAFPSATIFRPSVIFGAEDNFYNQFACMSRFLPFLPLIGGGKTRFQPVYVGDVADAFAAALADAHTAGHTYELGGAETLSFKGILQSICTMTHCEPTLLPIPSCMAKISGFFAEFLPRPLLTRDQVELLKYDNVVNPESLGFAALSITPKAPSDIVPAYLARFAKEHAPGEVRA
jgi:NADH dehydrogenase